MTPYHHEVAARLIAADTVSQHSNAAAMAYLADELDGLGFRVALQEAGGPGVSKQNLVAWTGPPEPGGLVLSGHVDVVPFADQPGWTRDALRFEIEGGRAFGRGTSDMKGFLAQCLAAARRLDAGTLQRPLVLLFTCDEEIGCRGAERLVDELPALLADVPLPRLAWIGEPTSYRVFHAHKGIVEFRVRVRGVGGHSGVPEAGANAIAVAAKAIHVIGGVQAEHRAAGGSGVATLFPDSPYTTFNFGTIRGGSASNMIAEECEFRVSYRPLPDTDPLEPYLLVEERLGSLDLRDWSTGTVRAGLEIGPPLVVPGLLSRAGTPLEKALFAALGESESGGAPYCTDGGRFARAGIDSLICGPGDLDQAHQPNESMGVAAFDRGPELILSVVARLCGGRPETGQEHR